MYQQPNFNQPNKLDKKRYLGVVFFVLLALLIIYASLQFRFVSNAIEVTSDEPTLWQKVANLFSLASDKPTIENDPEYTMPGEEKDRLDILILGVRGDNDEHAEEAGALLTDTILVLSFDKITKKMSLVSIPRDFYVRIDGSKKDKINAAYETGVLRKNPFNFTKKLISRITGIYIDNVVVFDFSSFKTIIDDLGGIDIELNRPFTEKTQWGYEFSLPAGKNHLDGQTALYYVRSRFSSSDFDRAIRQQKVILAIKDKVSALNLISDPIQSLTNLNAIKNNIQTDLNIWDANSLLRLSKEFDSGDGKLKRYVITTENLVYESHTNNIYVLLPKEDNLRGIKQLFQEIIK